MGLVVSTTLFMDINNIFAEHCKVNSHKLNLDLVAELLVQMMDPHS